ncbi:hypothetical protein BV210_05020 [Halorientalis sp. IM1011]|uniref:hypothetical protein n=1 Tax=Halorientalis sp. IM1011 TaxID=1932360 RepID=UPI00097CCA6E|nr:hypothetical protein [Halorientalis sp. IM1011]AQL42112.1 hypothetical protein BV210_05020 [Halorientalis sp. IM1011]
MSEGQGEDQRLGGDVSDDELDIDLAAQENGDVEDQIASAFIFKVMQSDVDVDMADVMNGLLHKDDFGGEDLIVECIEEEMLDDED